MFVKIKKSSHFIVILFIFIFLLTYFTYINNSYAKIKGFEIPFGLIIGFSLLIIIFFFVFVNYTNFDRFDDVFFKFKFLSEDYIRLIIIILMLISFLIPPIRFTESIMDWNQIDSFSYFRAIVMLIGSIYIPGSCLYRFFFPEKSIHKIFKVESFFLKLTIYPFLSIIFLSTLTILLDFLRLGEDLITFILFLSIFILFIYDLSIKKDKNNRIRLNLAKIDVSKYTFFIIMILLAILICTTTIYLNSKYLLETDAYKSISYSFFIGKPETALDDKFFTYNIYWGYISFSLSSLSGLPAINTNVMLYPLIYIVASSIYLFMKSFLNSFREIYSVVSTLVLLTFSCLFNFVYINSGRFNTSQFSFMGYFYFTYQSFSFSLMFISMAFFTLAINRNLDFKKSKISFITALFLLHCFLLYFIPVIPVIAFFVLYYIILGRTPNSRLQFRRILFYFIILFISYDLISTFFFSWNITWWISSFLRFNGLFQTVPFFTALILNSLIVYYLLMVCYIITVFLSSFNLSSKIKSKIKKIRINRKLVFGIILILFLELLIIELFMNNLIDQEININKAVSDWELYDDLLGMQFLNIFFVRIGIYGIVGIIISIYSYKKNKKIFYICVFWFLILFGISSILIVRSLINYPFAFFRDIPESEVFYMMYWFERTWFYSLIPLTLIFSISFLNLKNYLKSIKIRHLNKEFKLLFNLFLSASLIFFSFSRITINGIYWYNVEWYFEDEEAQVMGWVTENIPKGSHILIDRWANERYLESIAFCYPHFVWDEIDAVLDQNKGLDLDTLLNNFSDLIIEHLESKNIHYFIISFQSKDLYMQLILNYFSVKLYEYSDLSIYYNDT